MAEPVTQDQYRADMAEMNARFDTLEARLLQHMAEMELRLERSLTRTGWIAGLIGGGIAALPAYVAVSVALARLWGKG